MVRGVGTRAIPCPGDENWLFCSIKWQIRQGMHKTEYSELKKGTVTPPLAGEYLTGERDQDERMEAS